MEKKKPYKSEASNLHAGHRQRLRERAKREGLDGFDVHQVLELLLFYSIPRSDTNAIAHRLLERFGSFSGVLDASYENLLSVSGVSDCTASLLKLIPAVSRRYMLERHATPTHFSSLAELGNYLVQYYIGITLEMPVIVLVNTNRDIICDPIPISEGTAKSAPIQANKIARIAFEHNAAAVVLAHNHPNGEPIPSAADIALTKQLLHALEGIDIQLLEHIVVGNGSYQMVLSYEFTGMGRMSLEAF